MTFMGLKGLFSTYAEGMAKRTRMFATNIRLDTFSDDGEQQRADSRPTSFPCA